MDWYEDEKGNAIWTRSSGDKYTDKNGKEWKRTGDTYRIDDIIFKQRKNKDGQLVLYSEPFDSEKFEKEKDAIRDWQSTHASRSAQDEFWNNPTLSNWLKYCFTEVFGQYTDPNRVVGGLSASVAGYMAIRGVPRGGRSIVGTSFSEILPTQDWINSAQVTRYKIRIQQGERPTVIAYRQGGKVYIEDGHHRFVAYKELGIAPNVIIKETGGPVGFPNWQNTSFQTPPSFD